MAEKTVSFINPVDPVGSQVALQQLQRRQRLADALREQSLQDIPSNGGTISWTQGLAKIANALVSKSMQKDLDKRTLEIGMQGANATRGMFGLPAMGGGIVEQGPTPRTMGEAMVKMGMDPSTVSPAARSWAPISQGGTGSYGAPPSPQAPAPVQTVDVPPSGAPMAAEAAAPQEAPAQPTPQSYPMSLTGNKEQDYAYYVQNPEEYTKAVLAAHQPTDFVRMLQQGGIDPNSPIGRQLIQSNIAKQNYTAPVNGRPGSTLRDPYDPRKVIGIDAPSINGAIATYGADGMPTGYKTLDGASQAIATEAGAKTAGEGANLPVTAYDGAGNPVFTNRTNAAHGGGGLTPGQRPGFAQASQVTGTESAKQFGTVSEAAQDVPNRVLALNQMAALVKDPHTLVGPGSATANHIKGIFGTIGQSVGIAPPKSVDNAQEFNKWASQYSARSAQELGLSGSDSRVNLAVHATPNGEMQPGALKAIIPSMIGFENAKAGRANAAVAWQKSNGPDTFQQFSTQWNRNYDPRIYTWMAEGSVKQNMARLKAKNPRDYQEIVRKAQVLGNLGALSQ